MDMTCLLYTSDQAQIANFSVDRTVFGVVQRKMLKGRVKFDPRHSCCRQLLQQLQGIRAVRVDGGKGTQTAVSYTHLDVYKRQRHDGTGDN